MRKILQALAILVCLLALGATSKKAKKDSKELRSAPPVCSTAAQMELRFSPDGGCTSAIIQEIQKAKHKILLLSYSFTSDPIAMALIVAEQRGVEVEAVIDSGRTGEGSGDAFRIQAAGAEVYSDNAHAIQHQKVIVIDPGEETASVILGSFNFTAAAEFSNAENMLIVRSRELAAAFDRNYQEHKSHSTPLVRKAAAANDWYDNWYCKLAAVLAAMFLFYCCVKICRRVLYPRR